MPAHSRMDISATAFTVAWIHSAPLKTLAFSVYALVLAPIFHDIQSPITWISWLINCLLSLIPEFTLAALPSHESYVEIFKVTRLNIDLIKQRFQVFSGHFSRCNLLISLLYMYRYYFRNFLLFSPIARLKIVCNLKSIFENNGTLI